MRSTPSSAAYLAATGQVLGAALVFVTGELLKLVLVERLFSLTRNKLMKISAFVWAYRHYKIAMGRLKTTEAWKTMRALSYAALRSIRKLAGRGRPTPRYRAAREMTE
jgi:hypothetical protein